MCRVFFDVTAGHDAVAFVYTRHALNVLGKFDENIYPAYYEDHDMDLRSAPNPNPNRNPNFNPNPDPDFNPDPAA